MVKLFSLLKTLSRRELKLLEQYLNNPVVNQRSDVKLLLKSCVEMSFQVDREKAFGGVYPDKAFDKTAWHLLTSRLFKLAEQFLMYLEFKDDKLLQKILLAKAYRKKQIQSLFESNYKSTSKLLKQQDMEDAAGMHYKLVLEYEYYDYIASHDRKNKTNLQEVNDVLDEYYITLKLRNACLSIARKTINAEAYDIYLLGEVLTLVEEYPRLLRTPAIAVYYFCYRAITEKANEAWFGQLRSAIRSFSNKFEPKEMRDIILLAINYCIRKLNTGEVFYIREAFELYRLSFSEGYFLEDKKIPESTFINIVSLAVKLKEYKWATQFVETYKTYLNPNFEEPLYYYSLGLLSYEQGNYEESMVALAKINTKISFLLLAAKSLQLKIYYELGESEALDYLLESFRVYLQRKKDLGYRKENFENLIQFMKRLIAMPYKEEQYKNDLLRDVQEAKVFSEKEWFLERIASCSLDGR